MVFSLQDAWFAISMLRCSRLSRFISQNLKMKTSYDPVFFACLWKKFYELRISFHISYLKMFGDCWWSSTQRRVFAALSGQFSALFDAIGDLPRKGSPQTLWVNLGGPHCRKFRPRCAFARKATKPVKNEW